MTTSPNTTDSDSPAAVCVCGHTAHEHNNIACLVPGCGCNVAREAILFNHAVGWSARVAELEAAAAALLKRLDNMTTEQFANGGERGEREALRALLGGAS